MYCDEICPFARQRFSKHILEVTQSTVGLSLLCSKLEVSAVQEISFAKDSALYDGRKSVQCVSSNSYFVICQQWKKRHS
jgi:hypothetical protein